MSIIGHEKIIKTLNNACLQKKMAQAYLFCGPEAVGKFLIAMYFARKLTGESEGNINRNLFLIEPEIKEDKAGIFKEKEIGIDEIRKLQKELRLTSFDKNYRVAIIRSAQKMNMAAQNALLKILEEPPEKSTLMLVCEDEKKLLSTVISRCQIIRFNLLSQEKMKESLGAIVEKKKDIIFWSLGRPGLMQNFLKSKIELEVYFELEKEFRDIFSMKLNECLFLAEKMSKNSPELLRKMDLWIVLLRQVMLGDKSRLTVSPNRAMSLIEKIEETKKIITKTNSNARLALENLLVQF